MKLERENVAASELDSMDRRVIRVDIPPAHAGVTAALRRAFEAAANQVRVASFDEAGIGHKQHASRAVFARELPNALR